MNLIELSVKRPVLTTMVMLALGGIGAFCYTQLAKEQFPKVEFPMVTVTTLYPGAGPEEIEQLISKKLEDEISTAEGIKHLNSISQQGFSLVLAEFYLETKVDVAAADVRDKVNLVRPQLPDQAEDPIVQKFDFNAQPVMQLAVSAPRTLKEIFFMADQRIKDRLSTVPGVASVTIIGGEDREIHVLTNQQRLRANGLSITDVVAAVAAANLETPGGYIQQNSREYNLRLRGKFTSLDDIGLLQIPTPGGKSVYIRDIAEVRDAYKDIRDKVRANGQTCVGMSIQKRSDGNTVDIDQNIRKQIAELKKILPSDYNIEVLNEQASWIVGSLDDVFGNMRWGIVLTAITLFVFLHSLRGTFIISLSMPIGVAVTFLILYLNGFTLNIMSMMGLAMTIGVLVDNSVLVLENIVRHLHLGLLPRDAAIKGTANIALGVAASTLTNIVIFVPIAFMGGIIGQFFKDLGLAAAFATVCSLLTSFTLTPMLAARLLTKENTTPGGPGALSRFGQAFDRFLDRVRQGYANLLRTCLHHRGLTLLITLALMVSTMYLGKFIGKEFITPMDEGRFLLTLEMPTGTRLEETDQAMSRLEAILRDKAVVPELKNIYATIGQISGERVGGSSQAVNIAGINVELVAKDRRALSTEQIMNRIRPTLAQANIPGASIKLLQNGPGGGGEAPIQMQILGDDIEHVRQFAARALPIITKDIPGTLDVDSNFRTGQPEIRVIPDRPRCRDFDVDIRTLSQMVTAAFDGLKVSEYREGAFNYDIRVRNDESSRQTLEDIQQLTVINRQGQQVPLPQIAQIINTTGPAQLFRKDRQSQITISCDVTGRASGDVADEIKAAMEPLLKEYPDCRLFFGGEIENMQDSFGRLLTSLIMAICLTYMLLAAMLERFMQALIIMICVPLSMIGVMLGLFLMGGTFSIFSIMAIVVLVGMVINNAIIIMDFFNNLRAEGVERTEAFVTAGTTRLRPMLMTNLTTIVALIPLAAGQGSSGELQAPMGMVQIGGLVTGGGIGLLIVPVIFTLWDDLVQWFKGKIHKKS